MNGCKLQIIRENRGIGRKELADSAHVSESYIQSWEQGWYIQTPSSGEIKSMAEYLGLTEDDLMAMLEIDEEDLSDNKSICFSDFLDASVRTYKHIKENLNK